MKFILFSFALSVLSIVEGQQCRRMFNQSGSGQCSPVANCKGTIIASDSCGQQSCCVSAESMSHPRICVDARRFNALYNTSRGQLLHSILNHGILSTGICDNCPAQAAFLAVAATMTQNFQMDEDIGTDLQFAADDSKYGNNRTGDGSRFRRRGLFGLRGRVMYERLQAMMPQKAILNDPQSVALLENAIEIASKLWMNPNLLNETSLTNYTDGSFYGFSMLWYKLTGDIDQLSDATKYYSKFLHHLQCPGELYSGQGPKCPYNATHNGSCSADCIAGLEDSSAACGCSAPRGQCPNSPRHIRCCLDTCSQELKMDLGFVLDASGSVGVDNYQLQLQFTRNLLERVNVGPNKTHVGIVNYSTGNQTLTWLNANYSLQEKLGQVNQAVYFSASTNTADALRQIDTVFSYDHGRRSLEEGATPVIFVITDGVSDNQSATIAAANVLKGKNIILVSVGVGSGSNLNELHAICSPPVSENYFAMSDYNALEQKLNQFTSRSCSEPAYIPSNATVSGNIGRNKYKFLKLVIVAMGNKTLITITLLNGNVSLFHSFTNRNPKDPAEFLKYGTQQLNAISTLETKTNRANNKEVTLMIVKPDDKVDVAYVGIKGIEDENEFQVKFADCSKVNCEKSDATSMKLSLVLASISALFLL